MYLRQGSNNTVTIGQFVSSTDFVTPFTTAITAADIRLSINGAAFASKHTGGGTPNADGMCQITFDATDTATAGQLDYYVNKSGSLIVDGTFEILTQKAYDALFSTGLLDVNVTKIAGTTQTARDVGLSVLVAVGTGTGQLNIASGNVVLAATQSAYAPAKAGDAMTLTTGERAAIATKVELQIMDEADGNTVLQAIVNKINSVDADLSGLSVAAIAAAVWASGARTLTSMPAIPNNWLTNAGIANGAFTNAKFTGVFPTNFPSLSITAGGIVAADIQLLDGDSVVKDALVNFAVSYNNNGNLVMATDGTGAPLATAAALAAVQTHGDANWEGGGGGGGGGDEQLVIEVSGTEISG